MRHPTDGTLRRLLDEPSGVADADREHIAGCRACSSGLAAVREDAEAAGAALRFEVAADVEEGWRRLSREVGAGEPLRPAATGRGPRWRAVLRRPVVAVAGAVALLTGVGAAAAADWLQVFRAEKVAPVVISQADLLRLPDLSAYGEAEVRKEANRRRVAGADAAREITGLPVPRVGELPRGVTGEPEFQVGDQVSATFTFSVRKAAKTAAAAGLPLPPPPPGLDGSRFRLTAGPGLAAVWTEARGVPALMVARVVAPRAYSSGVPFGTARDYLLSLPGLPESVASQLRGFSGDGTTLPLVVKAWKQKSSATDVNGVPATVLTTRDGVMAGVLWVDGGVVTGVVGSLSADEVLSVARGLRWER
ncbi:hypothetical protein [Actinocorallia populi]|uniref:hypothetical protein n=1 Tax=Actinocorallia populi TaxID=2079200 RepID=UPI000D092F7B|nr:hypothetical protein [Actinocorallia populi]